MSRFNDLDQLSAVVHLQNQIPQIVTGEMLHSDDFCLEHSMQVEIVNADVPVARHALVERPNVRDFSIDDDLVRFFSEISTKLQAIGFELKRSFTD